MKTFPVSLYLQVDHTGILGCFLPSITSAHSSGSFELWPRFESTLCPLKTHLEFEEAECWLMYRVTECNLRWIQELAVSTSLFCFQRQQGLITNCVCVGAAYLNIIGSPRKWEEKPIAFPHKLEMGTFNQLTATYFEFN